MSHATKPNGAAIFTLQYEHALNDAKAKASLARVELDTALRSQKALSKLIAKLKTRRAYDLFDHVRELAFQVSTAGERYRPLREKQLAEAKSKLNKFLSAAHRASGYTHFEEQ